MTGWKDAVRFPARGGTLVVATATSPDLKPALSLFSERTATGM
jgi:hypothetical protein